MLQIEDKSNESPIFSYLTLQWNNRSDWSSRVGVTMVAIVVVMTVIEVE